GAGQWRTAGRLQRRAGGLWPRPSDHHHLCHLEHLLVHRLPGLGSSTVNGIPNTLDVFGRGDAGTTLGIPHSFLITVLAVIAAWWFLRYTKAGRNLYAIGGNREAARLAGLSEQRRLTWVYASTGLGVGL